MNKEAGKTVGRHAKAHRQTGRLEKAGKQVGKRSHGVQGKDEKAGSRQMPVGR